MLKSVLVVCAGNICRSPYAEYTLRKLLPDLKVTSAGTIVSISHLEGKPADFMAVQIASEYGINLKEHRARQLTSELINEHDVILVMEREQLEEICHNFPEANYKAFLFSRWIGAVNIDDPYQKDDLTFRLVFNKIEDAALEWVRKF
ncbi:low molecular weight protein-tyrosine-phosphatase [Vibrio salinus]|uniref:low molecular weight protein-tyrosine-phosphatase n=1 Tax=Vibrio salinus TaxID=2899784 RepID=UPI001E4C9278|nr:low molecular weight protein-tyrosine-phosphatase [Vibrio salinus]MCE0493254.1 low molecular weight phosphotyrosine protein phosphatase [Vibrio salinus]